MTTRVLSFIFILSCCGSAIAQTRLQRDSARQRYVQSFQDYFFIWPVIKQRSTSFEFRSNSAGQTVRFRPNNSYHSGFGMYLFEVGFELTFAMPLDQKKKYLYGESNAQDLQANVLGKRWGSDLFISDYRGFYKDDGSHQPLPGMPFPLRPDIHTHNVGVNGIYIFHPNRFSLRSAFNYAERQKKSGGSFLLSGTFNSNRITSDSSILTQKYIAAFGDVVDIHRLGSTTLSFAPGYAYNLVVKSFFVNATLAIGPAVNWIDYTLTNGMEFSKTRMSSFVDIRMAVGYNGPRFFSGVTLVSQSRNIKFETATFTSSSMTFKIVAGYRFREFGLLKRKATDLLFFLDK